jgi:hypothetical protein
MLVTPVIGLIIFGLILLVAILVAFYMKSYETYDRSTFHTFVAIISGFSIFITFMFYWNLLQLQAQQQQLAAVQELARINDSVLNSVLDGITTASAIIPNFVLSITPLTNTACCDTGTGGTGNTGAACPIPVTQDPITPQTCTEKMSLSYRIFALWQDFITSNRYIHYDATAYVSNFLQKANSPQLYAQWTVAYIDFNTYTQQLGTLLFEYGLPITEQTAANYQAVAEQLVADPRFQEIITK